MAHYFVLGAVLCCCGNSALAGTDQWIGGDVGNPTAWNNPFNWQTSVPDSSTSAIFSAAAGFRTVNVTTNSAALGLAFQGTSYSLTVNSTSTLTIGTGGITTTSAANAPTTTIDGVLDLAGDSTFKNLSGSATGIIRSGGAPTTITVLGTAGVYSGLLRNGGAGNANATSLTVGNGVNAAAFTLNVVTPSSNNYTGATLVNANATLIDGAANSFSANSDFTVNGTLKLAGGDESILSLNSASTGSINLATYQLTVQSGAFSGAIGGSTGGLTKSGTGTFDLSGAFSLYQGNTTINGGTLVVSDDIALGQGGTLNINGGTLSTPVGINSSRNIVLGISNGTVDVSSGQVTSFNGVISGQGSLTKAGTGTLDLVNSISSYQGNTTVNGGTLVVSDDSQLGLGLLTLNGGTLSTAAGISSSRTLVLGSSGGTINVAANQRTEFSGSIAGSGGLTKTGTGTLDLSFSAASPYQGNTTVTGGTLVVSDDSQLGLGDTLTLNGGTLRTATGIVSSRNIVLGSSGGTVNVSSNQLTDFSGPISGPGGLIKIGTGTLSIHGNQTYAGAIAVNQGTLQVDGSIAAATTTVTGATLGGTGTLGTTLIDTGGTLMAGDDTISNQTLSTGDLTFDTGASLLIKLDTLLAQTDTIAVTGELTLNNTALLLNDLAAGSVTLDLGTQFSLLTYHDGMGIGLGFGNDLFTFNDIQLIEGSIFTFGNNNFQVNYATGDPEITLTVVPEPTTWALVLTGIALISLSRRRVSNS